MQDPVDDTSGPDAGRRSPPDDWVARAGAAVAGADDEVTPLGPRHASVLHEAGPVLLVSFDTWPGAAPPGAAGAGLARAEGWSHLALLADGPTWWRCAAVHAYFDRLTDDGFFEDFDRVVFYGIGMGGYAAASFCVAAPGAAVVAIRPQATLRADATEWDRRFPRARRLDFADRYAFAPDMVEAAGSALIAYDPWIAEDAMHAGLFARPHVVRLRCAGAGPRPEEAMARSGLIAGLLRLAAQGGLAAGPVHRLHRAARRRDSAHLLRLLTRLTLAGRTRLARAVARAAQAAGL